MTAMRRERCTAVRQRHVQFVMIVWSPSTDDDPGIDPGEPAAAHPSPAPSERREVLGEAREITSRDDLPSGAHVANLNAVHLNAVQLPSEGLQDEKHGHQLPSTRHP
jgi:hypothetical protein